MSVSLCQIKLNTDNLRKNLNFLRGKGKPIMGVIKGDAYGHGLLDVAKVLCDEGLNKLAVGSVAEGVELRHNGFKGLVLALLGVATDADLDAVLEHQITPLVHDWPGLTRLTEMAGINPGQEPISIAIKVDSGLSRLGFAVDEISAVTDFLAAAPGLNPELFVSHLAIADHQDGDVYTYQQAENFQKSAAIMKARFPAITLSLANSACLIAFPELAGDLARPGVALYGCNPLHGSSREALGAELAPVMEACTPVLETRTLPQGTTIGYGREYLAPQDRKVAIVGIGYSDGFRRSAASRSFVCIHGHRAPVLGRICMQMTAVDVTSLPEVRAGDQAYLLGGPGQAVTAQEMADWWGTIPHEVTCIIGKNRVL